MLSTLLFFIIASTTITKSDDEISLSSPLEAEEVFPHYHFECPENNDIFIYETTFQFLGGLGVGFVHAESTRIYFEYYFPKNHWVGFAAADQTIKGTKDSCTKCYFKNYYEKDKNDEIETNESNLYPLCIEECLDEVIFVATANYDEENINDWTMMEFQIHSQHSKSLDKS